MRAERETLDARLLGWAASLTSTWLAEAQTYVSKVDGRSRTLPRRRLLSHLFNHQAHHPGQVTTLLAQRGVDMGSADLSFMPAGYATPAAPGTNAASGYRQHRETPEPGDGWSRPPH